MADLGDEVRLVTPDRGRLAHRILVALLAVGLVLLLIAWRQAREANDVEEAGRAAMKVARTSTPAILSYTDSNLALQLASSRALMTPAYAKRYGSMVKKRVWPQARKFGVANEIGVVAAGVVKATPETAVILVFANQTTRTKAKPEGITQGTRLEVTLRRNDERWLVDDVRPL